MSPKRRGYVFVAVGALLVGLLGISGYVSRNLFSRFDPLLRQAFASAEQIHSHQERVDSSLVLSDRTLRVSGLYLLDDVNKRYYAKASTTLQFVSGKAPVAFTVTNISIGPDVYTSVESRSKVQLSVHADGSWQHFKSDAIPDAYRDIAQSGPVLDNLKLFERGGSYLVLVARSSSFSGATSSLAHYTFKLAQTTAPDAVIAAIMQRLGTNGTIDVWIDPSSHEIRLLVLRNGPYSSTTTIDRLNEPLSITAPLEAKE